MLRVLLLWNFIDTILLVAKAVSILLQTYGDEGKVKIER